MRIAPSHNSDENNGLRTRRQIELFREREAAKRERAQRWAEEARVRHLNFDLVQRAVLLIAAVVLAFTSGLAAVGELATIKPVIGAAGIWIAIVTALYRFRPPRSGDD